MSTTTIKTCDEPDCTQPALMQIVGSDNRCVGHAIERLSTQLKQTVDGANVKFAKLERGVNINSLLVTAMAAALTLPFFGLTWGLIVVAYRWTLQLGPVP